MLKEYEITIEKGLFCLDVRLGLICVASIWPPKKNHSTWQVRLLFNQELGKIDYSKDMQFDSKEDCIDYILKEVTKWVKKLNRYFILNKKQKQYAR